MLSRLRSILLIAAIYCICCNHAYAQTIKGIRRASLSPASNTEGKSYSYDPRVDGSGRYIVFTSTADNFAADGSVLGLFHEHVYLRDTLLNTTRQLDVTSSGRSGSPSYDFNPNLRVFRSSFNPNISRNGKYILFSSSATDISPDSNGETFGRWAYLSDVETGEIRRLPKATASDSRFSEYPTYLAINADGSTIIIISIISSSEPESCTQCGWQLTLYDKSTNTTRILDTGITGNKFNPIISDDGKYLVFENQNGDFSAPRYSFLYDLNLSKVTPLNSGNTAISPNISGNSAYIAYTDTSSIQTRVKLLERETGLETLVSGGIRGEEPNGISGFASLNIDGRYIAFLSSANNLVDADNNNSDDIFVFDRVTGKTTLVSVQGSCKGISTNEMFNTGPPSINSDGSIITFAVLERLISSEVKDSAGRVTDPADTNAFDDVYVSTVDYNAITPIFRKGLTPAKPFVSVNCTGEQVRIQLQKILAKTASPKTLSSGSYKAASSVKSVSQQIIIQKIDPISKAKKVVKRSSSKRNEFTTADLPPGNYSAQVQAKATLKNGSVSTSKLSKASEFKITQ